MKRRRLMKTQNRLMKKVVMMKLLRMKRLKMMKKRKLRRSRRKMRRKPRRMQPVSIPHQSIITISISSREQKLNWTLGENLFQSPLTPRKLKLQLTVMTPATVIPTLIALKITLRRTPMKTQRIAPRTAATALRMPKQMMKHLQLRRKIRKRTPFNLFSTRLMIKLKTFPVISIKTLKNINLPLVQHPSPSMTMDTTILQMTSLRHSWTVSLPWSPPLSSSPISP